MRGLKFNRDDEGRSRLRLHPIVDPTLGHLAMLPVGSEGALINFNAGEGGRAIEAFEVTEEFVEFQRGLIAEHGPDRSIDVDVLLYVLPEGWTGPLS